MLKRRPALTTLLLSAVAVLGYLAYRAITPEFRGAAEQGSAAQTDPADSAQNTRALVDRLPEFTLDSLPGEPQSIGSWPGKPLLINFWATWCAPCLREIPMLKALQASDASLQVVGIALDRREEVVGFADRMQFNYPILIGQSDGWEAAAAFGVDFYALPFTVFTAADGRVLGVHTGELHQEHLDEFTAILRDLREQKTDIASARARLARRE
jgi:thiol-disulfide isomerase/thioredoxin